MYYNKKKEVIAAYFKTGRKHHIINYIQGPSQDLGGGGVGKNFFSDLEICMTPEKFLKMVQFGAFWCVF